MRPQQLMALTPVLLDTIDNIQPWSHCQTSALEDFSCFGEVIYCENPCRKFKQVEQVGHLVLEYLFLHFNKASHIYPLTIKVYDMVARTVRPMRMVHHCANAFFDLCSAHAEPDLKRLSLTGLIADEVRLDALHYDARQHIWTTMPPMPLHYTNVSLDFTRTEYYYLKEILCGASIDHDQETYFQVFQEMFDFGISCTGYPGLLMLDHMVPVTQVMRHPFNVELNQGSWWPEEQLCQIAFSNMRPATEESGVFQNLINYLRRSYYTDLFLHMEMSRAGIIVHPATVWCRHESPTQLPGPPVFDLGPTRLELDQIVRHVLLELEVILQDRLYSLRVFKTFSEEVFIEIQGNRTVYRWRFDDVIYGLGSPCIV